MYACQVEPIVPEQEVVSLVRLLHGMAKDFQGSLVLMLLHLICLSLHATEREKLKKRKEK